MKARGKKGPRMKDAKEYNREFAKRLKYFLDRDKITQQELAQKLGVSPQAVTNWVQAVKTPRMDKVDAMCSIFHCRRSDFSAQVSYEDLETQEYLQELRDRNEMRMLFKSARGATKEQIEAIVNLLESMKGQ